jgi:putative transposase
MPSSYCNLRIHLIWSTKNRDPLIHPSFESRLFDYLGGILRNHKHVLLAAGGMPDHIHLLIGQHPTDSISDIIRDLKTNSSGWIHQEIPTLKNFSWQTGYGAFSVSKSNELKVGNYIRNQKEHHREHSFEEEFLELLERHEIEYDKRFIWE